MQNRKKEIQVKELLETFFGVYLAEPKKPARNWPK